MANALLAVRATRVADEVAEKLGEISLAEDLKPSQVDRLLLTWCAERVLPMMRDGQSLKHFLEGVHIRAASAAEVEVRRPLPTRGKNSQE